MNLIVTLFRKIYNISQKEYFYIHQGYDLYKISDKYIYILSHYFAKLYNEHHIIIIFLKVTISVVKDNNKYI